MAEFKVNLTLKLDKDFHKYENKIKPNEYIIETNSREEVARKYIEIVNKEKENGFILNVIYTIGKLDPNLITPTYLSTKFEKHSIILKV